MPRSRIADYMQDHRFWLFDVVPSSAFPFYVLGSPILGFQSISMPEYTAEVDSIKQVNSMFKRPVYSGGEVSPVTLTRGVRGWDSSMWDWMHRAIKGYEVTQRHLLLVHYTNINADADNNVDIPVQAWESASFLPGQAILLWEAIPTRFKPGSDFDATSGAVSVAELEIQPWAMSVISLLDPL